MVHLKLLLWILNALAVLMMGWPIVIESRVVDRTCPAKLNNCTLMVQPYLHDLKYMFPTSMQDVGEMCKMWSEFVDCVRRYVSVCFTEDRRQRFNIAVENSVDTVHAICSSDTVQKEYLANAQCFRRVSVESCGRFYRHLIDTVSNNKAYDDHICCSYGQFKECVSDPLLRECGTRARNLMDHSMGFLIQRCGPKALYSIHRPCPVAAPSTETTSPKFESLSSEKRGRSETSQEAEAYSASTIVYSLPPGGRVAASHGCSLNVSTKPLLIVIMVTLFNIKLLRSF